MTSILRQVPRDHWRLYELPTNIKELSIIATDERPWYLGPYFILSTVLVTVTLAFPLVGNILGTYVMKLTLSLLLFGALYAVVAERRIFRVLGALLLPLIAGNWLFDPANYTLWAQVTFVVTMLFFATTTIAIFTSIIKAKKVTTDIIFGAVAVYMLVGVIVANLFLLLHNVDPGGAVSNIDALGNDAFSDILYFSFVTLTSVGYGDFAPNSPVARTLATATGIFGQLYLAILIAKLVGIYTAQTLRESE